MPHVTHVPYVLCALRAIVLHVARVMRALVLDVRGALCASCPMRSRASRVLCAFLLHVSCVL